MSLLSLENLMNKSLGKKFSEEKNNFEKSIDTLYNSNLSDEDLLLLNDNVFNELVAEDFSVECLIYNTIMYDDILEAASGLLDYKQNQEYLDIYYKITEVLGTEAVENTVKEQGFFGKIWEGIKSVFKKIIDAFKKLGAAIKRFFTGKGDEEKSEKQEEAYQEAVKLERTDPNARKFFKLKSANGNHVLNGVFANKDLGGSTVVKMAINIKSLLNGDKGLRKSIEPILVENSLSDSKTFSEIVNGGHYRELVTNKNKLLSKKFNEYFKVQINFETDKDNEIVNKIFYGHPNPKKIKFPLSSIIKFVPSTIFKTEFNSNITRITDILNAITTEYDQFINSVDSKVKNNFNSSVFLNEMKGDLKHKYNTYLKNVVKILQGLKDQSIKIGRILNSIIKEYIYLKNELTKAYNIALKNEEKYNKKMDKKEAKMEQKAAKKAEKDRIKAMKEEQKAAKKAEKEAKKNK